VLKAEVVPALHEIMQTAPLRTAFVPTGAHGRRACARSSAFASPSVSLSPSRAQPRARSKSKVSIPRVVSASPWLEI
jgi:hypothetical protein